MEYRNINDNELLYMISDNEDAYNLLIYKYMPLVKRQAKTIHNKYKSFGVDFDDICQEGLIGLTNAIKLYQEEHNCLFYTLAITLINREILKYIQHCVRYKNIVLSFAISLNSSDEDDKMNLENMLYNKFDDPINKIIGNMEYNNFIYMKYEYNDIVSQIFELKYNNFSNIEISQLLDVDYKIVDNAIYKIRKDIKNKKMMIE